MTALPTLFDAAAERDAAISQVVANAGITWAEYAWDWLVAYLRTHPDFFADDAWAAGLERPHDMRAFGGVVIKARHRGYIVAEPTASQLVLRRGQRLRCVDAPTATNLNLRHRLRLFACFIAKDDDECWPWLGRVGSDGYGVFFAERGTYVAHRLVYEFLVGPIPNGLVLDHLCHVRSCVNPSHLQPVTHRTNILRGAGASAVNAAKTHCKNGHEFTPENTYVVPRTGARQCRPCRRGGYPSTRKNATARTSDPSRRSDVAG